MNKENREWIEGTLDIAQDDLVFQQPAMKSQGDGELCLRRAGDRQGEGREGSERASPETLRPDGVIPPSILVPSVLRHLKSSGSDFPLHILRISSSVFFFFKKPLSLSDVVKGKIFFILFS